VKKFQQALQIVSAAFRDVERDAITIIRPDVVSFRQHRRSPIGVEHAHAAVF
jgi:hypothetical protein